MHIIISSNSRRLPPLPSRLAKNCQMMNPYPDSDSHDEIDSNPDKGELEKYVEPVENLLHINFWVRINFKDVRDEEYVEK